VELRMKTAYVLGVVLAVHSLSGCNKSSDRYRGIEKQPAHPQERNPGTQPTTPSGGPEGPTTESPDTAPAEDPDTRGTTRSPSTVDGIGQAGAGTTARSADAPMK
jgi:hypothetical protein